MTNTMRNHTPKRYEPHVQVAWQLINSLVSLFRSPSYPLVAREPHVRDPADPLQIEVSNPKLELNFRTPLTASGLMIVPEMMGTCAALVSYLLVIRLVGDWLTYSGIVLSIVLTMLTIVLFFELVIPTDGVFRFLLQVLLLCVAVLVAKFVCTNAIVAALLSLLAIVVTCNLANQIGTNYVAWLSANPRLSKAHAAELREGWRDRNKVVVTPESMWASAFFITGSIGAAMAICSFFAPIQFFGLGFVVLLLAFLVLSALASLLWQPIPASQATSVIWAAVVNWFAYQTERPLPGVYQSPFTLRKLRVTVVLGGLAMSLLPLASYFPLHLALVSDLRWRSADRLLPKVLQEIHDRFIHPPSNQVREENASTKHMRFRDSSARGERSQPLVPKSELHSEVIAQLRVVPEAWILAGIRGLITGDARFLLAIMTGLVSSVLAPLIVLASITFLVLGRSLPKFALRVRELERREGTDFDYYVERLIHSEYIDDEGPTRERDHLFLGFDSAAGRPILLSKDLLNGHAHIVGSTQSGKTSMALSPMLAQMIRGLDPKSPEFRTQSSILVLDLKGDPALFHNVHDECRRQGIGFKYFTTGYRDATYAFNPFDQTHLADVSPEQRIDMLARGMGISYGHDYPQAFWSDKNTQMFRTILTRYTDIRSFARLSHYVKDAKYFRAAGGYLEDWKKASHVTAAAQKLAGIVPLNVTKDETPSLAAYCERIDMRPLGSNKHDPQVVYFYIRATDQETTGHDIAKLALFSFLTAINTIPESEKKRTYVYIDEFQVIALDILSRLFEQAAGLKISYILSNQSLMILPEVIREVLTENTAFRQIFRAGSLDVRRYIRERSGETIYQLHSSTVGNYSTSTTTEYIGPAYRDADIVDTSYDDRESWIEMTASRGFSRYGGNIFTIRTDFHITRDEYIRRSQLPWPAQSRATFIAAQEEHILSHYTSNKLTQHTKREMVTNIEQLLQPLPLAPSERKPMLPDKPIQPCPELDKAVAEYEQAYSTMMKNIEHGKVRNEKQGEAIDE